jgi:type IV secretory pathway VirB10-like protein
MEESRKTSKKKRGSAGGVAVEERTGNVGVKKSSMKKRTRAGPAGSEIKQGKQKVSSKKGGEEKQEKPKGSSMKSGAVMGAGVSPKPILKRTHEWTGTPAPATKPMKKSRKTMEREKREREEEKEKEGHVEKLPWYMVDVKPEGGPKKGAKNTKDSHDKGKKGGKDKDKKGGKAFSKKKEEARGVGAAIPLAPASEVVVMVQEGAEVEEEAAEVLQFALATIENLIFVM